LAANAYLMFPCGSWYRSVRSSRSASVPARLVSRTGCDFHRHDGSDGLVFGVSDWGAIVPSSCCGDRILCAGHEREALALADETLDYLDNHLVPAAFASAGGEAD
jgi:hypothetical protein